LKKLLIISPYFPPSNTADMQRVRMSLPYFSSYGWEAEVIMVGERYTDLQKDPLLLRSIPPGIKIHTVKAFPKIRSGKAGMGSLAWRCLWHYRRKVNELLKSGSYDLIFFSTTQFPVCVLGAYWKKHFGIPYVIDMQDPWSASAGRQKPNQGRSLKRLLNDRLHGILEPVAIKNTSGLISVSAAYIEVLKTAYPSIARVPAATIPFGAFAPDLGIAVAQTAAFPALLDKDRINLVYIGRGGADMHDAIIPLFRAIRKGLDSDPARFSQLKIYFIGTSYAPAGKGEATILPLAGRFKVSGNVVELTDRISYYHALATLQQADALFIPGSDDPAYSASKDYPYLLTNKPLLAITHPQSPLVPILAAYGSCYTYSFNDGGAEEATGRFLVRLLNGQLPVPRYDSAAIQQYAAETLTGLQCALFEQALIYQ